MSNSEKSGSLLVNIEEEQAALPNEEPGLFTWMAADIIEKLLGHWRLFLLVLGIAAILSSMIALLIPNRYSSMAQLMPPAPNAFVSQSTLTSPFGVSLAGAALSSNLLNEKTPSAIAIGIMSSPKCLDDVINHLNLRSVYHVKRYRDAQKQLIANTKFAEDRKTGIVSIIVEDSDKYRARDIAQAYIDDLNDLLNNLTVSTAHRERIFLEGRLSAIKESLDSTTNELAQYSSQNAALDPTKQDTEAVEAAGRLQDELITAESNLSALRMTYTNDNVLVREAMGKVAALKRELQNMTGSPEEIDMRGKKRSDPLPSVRQLPLLGVKYYDLYRKMSMQEALYESLSKQYETAKVQEAEEMPTVKVLTPPDVAEIKSFPPRTMIVFAAVSLTGVGWILWLVPGSYWKYADERSPIKVFVRIIMKFARKSKSERANVVNEADAGSKSD